MGALLFSVSESAKYGWLSRSFSVKLLTPYLSPVHALTLGGNTSFGLSVAPSANSSFIALMVAGIPFS